ncbi:MAG: hypothetical protein GXX10_05770 [Clostridiaceae bacterium]|nr:hypothetical protein [Clostridiaceae bacterium]
MAKVDVSDTWKDKAVDFVVRFQELTGLTVDGKAGNDTNTKLDEIIKKYKEPPKEDGKAIKDAWNKFLDTLK